MLTNIEVKKMLIAISEMYGEREEELSLYDAVIGDGDHGVTMARGARAAIQKMQSMEEGSVEDFFKAYGRTLVSTLGGAIGPLFGSLFLEWAKAAKGKEMFDVNVLCTGLARGEEKIMSLGGAVLGDKTMLDAIHPTVLSLIESLNNKDTLAEGLEKAKIAAREGRDATVPMMALKGRSRHAKELSVGHVDAGATSFYYLMETMENFVASR